jgi:hypothetical protein
VARQEQAELLRRVVEASFPYPTVKRVLVWGSFVTDKTEPNDLDYSVVVSSEHHRRDVAEEHRRFLVPAVARQHYGVDTGYLLMRDYPLEFYIEQVDFICQTKGRDSCGIVEISIRGEVLAG